MHFAVQDAIMSCAPYYKPLLGLFTHHIPIILTPIIAQTERIFQWGETFMKPSSSLLGDYCRKRSRPVILSASNRRRRQYLTTL